MGSSYTHIYTVAYLHGAATGAAVRARQHRRPSLGGATSGQQIIEQRRRPGTDEGVERGDRKDAQLIQSILCGARDVGEQ